LVLALIPMVLGANEDGNIITGGKLLITDMDVKVDSKTDKNMDFGDRIKHEAQPGSTVEFKLEITNNFTNAEDLEIEDIQVTITIEGIDDDDDLEEEAREFDLKDGKDENKRISFKIPLEVDEDTFDVLIEVEGDDENGTTHEVQFELELEIEKEDNEVLFWKNTPTLIPSEIKCGRNVQLSIAIINTGSDDEDDVSLEITNTELGVNFRETFDLTEDPFDADSKFRKTYSFTLPSNIPVGIYSILSKITFDDGSDTETDTVDLVVGTCAVLAEEEEEEEEVVVVQPTVTGPTTPTGGVTVDVVTPPVLPATEEKSVFQSTGFLTALIAGEVLLIIVAILVVVMIVRKRRD